jgi:hypothetical protein
VKITRQFLNTGRLVATYSLAANECATTPEWSSRVPPVPEITNETDFLSALQTRRLVTLKVRIVAVEEEAF